MIVSTILNILGGLALFVFGLKLLNIGMQNMISRNNFRKKINFFVNSDFKAFLTGIFITATSQSSTAVSVMTISLADAKLVSLRQSIGVIIGANIGTTLTAWCVVLFGLRYNIWVLYIPLLLIGVPIYFIKKGSARNWGLSIIGLALVFLAINLLKNIIVDSMFIDWLTSNDQVTLWGVIAYFFIGVVITALVQSSSVVIALAIITASQGDYSIILASSLILGANVGTTLTGQIAASIGNVHAKRVAYFHTLFNLVGVFLIFPFIHFISLKIESITSNFEFYIASFHTFFNLIIGLVCYFMIPQLVKFLTTKIISKSKVSEDLHYIDVSMSVSPIVHLVKAHNEAAKFASITIKTVSKLESLIKESDKDKFEEGVQRIIELEEESDQLEDSIRVYLDELIDADLPPSGVRKLQQLSVVIHSLENVSDLALKLAYLQRERKRNHVYFKPRLRKEIMEIQSFVNSATHLVIRNLNEEDKSNIQFEAIQEIEDKINTSYKGALEELDKQIKERKVDINPALYFKEIVEIYETIGDFLFKVNKALLR